MLYFELSICQTTSQSSSSSIYLCSTVHQRGVWWGVCPIGVVAPPACARAMSAAETCCTRSVCKKSCLIWKLKIVSHFTLGKKLVSSLNGSETIYLTGMNTFISLKCWQWSSVGETHALTFILPLVMLKIVLITNQLKMHIHVMGHTSLGTTSHLVLKMGPVN